MLATCQYLIARDVISIQYTDCNQTCSIIWLLGRVGKQRLREAKIQVVDYLILLLAGICIGTLAKVSDENFGATGYTHTVIAVCKFKNSNFLALQ